MKVCKRLGRLMEDEIDEDITVNVYHHKPVKKDNPEDYPRYNKPHHNHCSDFNYDINKHHQSFFKSGDIKEPGHRTDDYYRAKGLEVPKPILEKDYPDSAIMFINSELEVQKVYNIKITFNNGTVIRSIKEGDIVRAFFVEAGDNTNNLVEVIGKITYIDEYNIIHIDYSEKYTSESLSIPIYAIRFITSNLSEKVPFIEYDKKNDFCADLLPNKEDKKEYEDPNLGFEKLLDDDKKEHHDHHHHHPHIDIHHCNDDHIHIHDKYCYHSHCGVEHDCHHCPHNKPKEPSYPKPLITNDR